MIEDDHRRRTVAVAPEKEGGVARVKRVGAATAGAFEGRRRQRADAPRRHRVTARFSEAEYGQLLALAAAERLAVAAYVVQASLAPLAGPAGRAAVPDAVREALVELMRVHRQLRGACTNLNQAVAKLHSLGEPVEELPVIAAYVRRVTDRVDQVVAELAGGPQE